MSFQDMPNGGSGKSRVVTNDLIQLIALLQLIGCFDFDMNETDVYIVCRICFIYVHNVLRFIYFISIKFLSDE